MDDHKVKAVVDRIEDRYVVLLMGEEEKELHVPLEQVPGELQEGEWVIATLSAQQEVISLKTDKEETEKIGTRIQEKAKHLKQRMASRFKK
ncbi:hypothetical protein CathTA2_2179 [Caldalkalibacillus thermarum TA2.A1]|uniref:DUF3006 domain-containing protein n=1 Tax=Caldalkalibacillus thermarum (strain TA2.A1) TaxID=986075 RepID=F5L8M4_CALTT|nr:DUF3006 domain-containing protein [Caldalkalibacillus thermarum]EGL82263.1 hypothetical protein CathTA2_2179 [Caldalkalibacillus thermarum TA2.A1]QZT33442.1 DUF3006 domain-containing protein [Caldalkalibacillus thermarum TA2.A1]GGK29290.1 hypothetical protein GCM10010965_22720 [Caldalkalibacillus thermarum]